jgi:hypothetical protein
MLVAGVHVVVPGVVRFVETGDTADTAPEPASWTEVTASSSTSNRPM